MKGDSGDETIGDRKGEKSSKHEGSRKATHDSRGVLEGEEEGRRIYNTVLLNRGPNNEK
jgi:hypothetical protein